MRIITLVMSALLLAACSAVDDATGIAEDATEVVNDVRNVAEDVSDDINGDPDQKSGRLAVAVNVGSAHHESLTPELLRLVSDAVDKEVELRVVIVNSANAAEALEVRLPQGGSYELNGRNSSSRSESAEELIDASMEAIVEALPAPIPSGSAGPADLFGSLERLSAWVADAPEGEPQRVTLVTGGGIHRSTELDAVQSFSEGEALNGPALTAEEVDVELIGIARFSGSDSGITTEFTDHIMQTWTKWCAVSTTKSCSIAS